MSFDIRNLTPIMNKINIKKLFKFSADMICLIDSKGVFMSVSNSSLHILGYTPLEMLGKLYKDFIFPDDIPLAETARENMQTSSHIQFQNRYIHKNGSLIPLLWSASWDKREGLAYCIARNGHITKQAESLRLSLEESNKRYKYVTKATSDAIWDWDLEKGSLYWGDGFEAIFGYDIQKVPGGISSWTEHIHPDDSVTVLKSIYAVINGSDTNWKQEYRYRKADGSFADVVDRGFVIRNDDGKAVRMVGAMHDISERKIALKQLKRITEDLQKIKL
jgi:PAS domain S-box-containing protein